MDRVEEKIIGLDPNFIKVPFKDLFSEWHENRYFIQCYYNLQEKYDCGLITEKDFQKIDALTKSLSYDIIIS